jgi:hypothetical protein
MERLFAAASPADRLYGTRSTTDSAANSQCQYCVTFQDFTAVNMKNVVFWDVKTQFVLHRKHVSARDQSVNAM